MRNWRRRQTRAVEAAMRALTTCDRDRAQRTVHECLLLYGSAERPELLVQFLSNCTPDILWPVLLAEFSSCGRTWFYMPELRRLAESAKQPSCAQYLSGAALTRFDRMPSRIRVYRGCSRARIDGLSWTINRAVAESFAYGHRGVRVPNAVIATGTISKNDIYGLIVDRSEEEVLLEPDLLSGVENHNQAWYVSYAPSMDRVARTVDRGTINPTDHAIGSDCVGGREFPVRDQCRAGFGAESFKKSNRRG
jgi:hypothetical protein